MKAQTTKKSFGTWAAGLAVIVGGTGARAQPAPESSAPAAPVEAAAPAPAPPPGPQAGGDASVGEAPRTGNPSKRIEPPPPPSVLKVEFYGALLPFLERAGTSGATPPGLTGGASQVPDFAYSGVDEPARFRMTSGTSGIGFRGTLDLFTHLKVTWQVEAAVPIDGNGPRDFYTLASRNSHIGFTGGWGTLIWGTWDTPYKWATLVTINPIKGSFAPDYTAIIGTPGFGVSAVNATSILQGDLTNAAFYRREANSVQYWSPTLAGFSLRLSGTVNEDRPHSADNVVRPNPYLLSGYLGFDRWGLRIRAAYELHHDYFGMYNMGALISDEATTSTDQGRQLTVQYTLTASPRVRTRLVAVGEQLSYRSRDPVPDAFDRYERFAYYALLEQTVSAVRAWASYGQAFEGSCHRASVLNLTTGMVEGGSPCSTSGLGARMMSAGLLYAFDANTEVYVAGYRVLNDASSIHAPVPALYPLRVYDPPPGSDWLGVGVGIFYSFSVGLYR
jgi:predicted porin